MPDDETKTTNPLIPLSKTVTIVQCNILRSGIEICARNDIINGVRFWHLTWGADDCP